MENMKKYEYILDQTEIREFSFYAILEQAKYHKGRWFRLLIILVLELVLIPRVAGWMAVLIAVLLLVSMIRTYHNTGKSISGQRWTVWLDGGMLKVNRDGSSEVPCSNIQLMRTTRRLLMLGICRRHSARYGSLFPCGYLRMYRSGSVFWTGSVTRRIWRTAMRLRKPMESVLPMCLMK